jgi:putative spermidine/putrescine transport system ATP-binding protein/spermidine/putrescine transport system ATP-binding protein
LDEPLANLDRELRAEMEVEIRRYQKQLNIPFVYVTHNQEEALTMSDRIAVMRNGIFEQVGARAEVYQKPATAFVATFVGQSNHLSGVVESVESATVNLKWRGQTLAVPKREDLSAGDAMRFSIKYEDVEIVSARPGMNGHAGQNCVPGRLRDIIFKGQTANYIVQLPDDTEIVASRSPRDVQIDIGESVLAVWSKTAGMGFRA